MKTTLEEYRKQQMRILKDFCVTLTPEQKKHMESLTSEIAIENYKRVLLGIESSPRRVYCVKGRVKGKNYLIN